MGVVSLHQFKIPEGLSGQQTVDNLIKALETLGAKKVGTFLVDCETYYSAGITPPKILNIIHNSDQPATCYALLDSGISISVDNNFDMLMLTLSGIYQSKKSSKMECKGPKMQLGDFTVKIGSVTIGPSFKGILLEIEYGPCVVPSYCWDLMKEFMSSFMHASLEPHPHLQGKMNEIVTPMDITQQYNDQFNILRKSNLVTIGTINSQNINTVNNSSIANSNPNKF